MRVLAVAHGLGEPAADGEIVAGRAAEITGEPGGDRRVVGGSAGVGLEGERPTRLEGHAALVELGEHAVVVGGFDDDGDVGVVLGGGADHGGAADVDVLDGLVDVRPAGDGRFERVEVDDEDVDALDAVLGHGGGVMRLVTHGEQAAVDLRVQRLHPAVHDLGEAGDVGDLGHRHAGLRQHRLGAAGGQEFDAAVGQRPREVDQSGLVGYGEQRALGLNAVRVSGHDDLRRQ